MTAVTVAAATTSTTVGPELKNVTTLSGQVLQVMGLGEKRFFQDQQKKYMEESAFTAIADLQDLDRMLFIELMIHRATCWLSSGRNYHGEILSPSEESDCRRVIKENSPLLSQVKNDLGLTKSQRDRDQYESVGKYLADLKARATEHGVKREKELTKALCLIKELFSLVGTYDRSNDVERQKLGLESADDILEWIRDVMEPEFNAIDAYFRVHQQKFWVRSI